MKIETVKEIINTIKGTRFASLDTTTSVSLKGGKGNPFQGRVVKKTLGSTVILAVSAENVYANMVKKRLLEEGKDFSEFKLQPRKWGVREGDTCIINHNDKKYLECIFVKGGHSTYYVDGIETPAEDIEGLETTKKVNEESQGGLDNKVVIRTFDVESIDEIRINGEVFE